jgi:hypothetical protein
MKTNVGNIDRVVRVLVGAALIGATLAGLIGAWGWIGVLPLITGLIRVCPAYSVIGVDTCGTRNP